MKHSKANLEEEASDKFITKGVYKLVNTDKEYLFVCLPLSMSALGKIVQYKADNPRKPDVVYHKTGVSFLLNCYHKDTIKSLFTQRSNYELIGIIGKEYQLYNNYEYLVRTLWTI